MLMHSCSRHFTTFFLFSIFVFQAYAFFVFFLFLHQSSFICASEYAYTSPFSRSAALAFSFSPLFSCPELLIYSSSPIRRPCSGLASIAWSLSVWWFIVRANGRHPLSDCLSGSRSPRASFVNSRHRKVENDELAGTGRPMLGTRRRSLSGLVSGHAKQSNQPNRSGYCELSSALTSYALPMSPVFIPFAILADDVSKTLQLYSMSNISGFKEHTIYSPCACVSAHNVLQNNIIIEWAINNESQ